MKRALGSVALHAVLLFGAGIALLPLVWMIAASLMPAGEASAYPPRLLPSAPTLQHYRELWLRLDVARAFANSLGLALAITAVSLLLNSMAGYAFAKLSFRGRDRIFRGLLTALVIPAQVGMLPLFLLLHEMGLIDTYAAVVIPGLASVFGIFLVRQYALSIPDSLLDAARVDGASELRVYWSIALPILRPVLVTLAIFTFLASWNDFMWPLIVLSDQAWQTAPVALAGLSREHVQDNELMMAGSVVTLVPVLALFFVLQRHYIEGLLLGSVKG